MGDLPVLSPMPNGWLTQEEDHHPSLLSLLSPSSSNPNPLSIGEDCWLRVEQTTQDIISRIQPTVISEQRRHAVIDYVQRLIRSYLGVEVFPFGSVPLKTYLPDGDIDLTALISPSFEAALANNVHAVLEGEEQNNAAEFQVKDVQSIHAEVKLVKCLVKNIVVDISFNQLGGLCTLCFLEQVDQLIGKDHLFKRSIVLIKAWCYYESRILGAHHALISTYALETMVLYIFHLFHSSLSGPLSVLYRFLDYFSKFDWDNYCISLNGPVSISSLPEIVVVTPENDGGDLLLGKEFLNNCVNMFSVPLKGPESKSRAFSPKYLNIIDPLKENNNLGRSVSKGNLCRIRSAFAYGAKKLGQILLQPSESTTDEVKKFFMNTLDRHGNGQRPDVHDPFSINGTGPASSKSDFEESREDKTVSGSLYTGISDIRISGIERKPTTILADEPQRHAIPVDNLSVPLKIDDLTDGVAILESHRAVDAEDLVNSTTQSPRFNEEIPKFQIPSRETYTSLLAGPHLSLSHSFPENQEIGNHNQDKKMSETFGISENKASNWVSRAPVEDVGLVSWHHPVENELATNNISYSCPSAYPSEDFSPHYRESDWEGTVGSPKTLNPLSDLSGDYENHLRNLWYGRWCLDPTISESALPICLPSPSHMRSKNPWDTVHRLVQLKQNVIPSMNVNGIVQGSPLYPANSPLVSGANAFSLKETTRPRGVGTYFPNMNHLSNKDIPSPARGRNPTPVTHGLLPRSPHNNGRAATLSEIKSPEKASQEPSLEGFPALPVCSKPTPLRLFPQANENSLTTEKFESGAFGCPSVSTPPLPEVSQPDSSTSQDSTLSLPSVETERPGPMMSTMNSERVAAQLYHLKDEKDFPPLSS